MGFFLETLFGGLMVGTLYALIAIGFVLIFKASGVFNFAMGAMVLFAALAMARFSEWIPQWLNMEPGVLTNVLAMAVAMVIMVGVAWLIERLALRHLVNQEPITLLMATLGIAYLLDGLGPMIFGSAVYSINVGMPKDPIFVLGNLFEGGLLLSLEDLYAAGIAALLVALVVGIIWGSKVGVQFSLSLVALKALPVVILGGLTSLPGAIVGGLIIGVGEKLSEVYIGPLVGGGIETWFAYGLALCFLLFRPQGLFGDKIIDRV